MDPFNETFEVETEYFDAIGAWIEAEQISMARGQGREPHYRPFHFLLSLIGVKKRFSMDPHRRSYFVWTFNVTED